MQVQLKPVLPKTHHADMQKLTGFAAADGTAWQRRRLCRPAPAELLKKQARFPGKQQPDINVFPQNCFRTVKQFSQAEKSGFPVGMLPQGKRQKEDTAERDSQAAANQGCLCHRCCRRSWLPCGDSRCGRDGDFGAERFPAVTKGPRLFAGCAAVALLPRDSVTVPTGAGG